MSCRNQRSSNSQSMRRPSGATRAIKSRSSLDSQGKKSRKSSPLDFTFSGAATCLLCQACVTLSLASLRKLFFVESTEFCTCLAAFQKLLRYPWFRFEACRALQKYAACALEVTSLRRNSLLDRAPTLKYPHLHLFVLYFSFFENNIYIIFLLHFYVIHNYILLLQRCTTCKYFDYYHKFVYLL